MEDEAVQAGEARPEHSDHEQEPIGTLFILMLFLIVLAGMWGAVYFIFLGR